MDIILSKRATKALKALDAPTRGRIIQGIHGIPKGDIKPLKGTRGTFRLRVGDWRILFSYIEQDEVIVEKISPRGDIYKGV